jgi:hypothetical protein
MIHQRHVVGSLFEKYGYWGVWLGAAPALVKNISPPSPTLMMETIRSTENQAVSALRCVTAQKAILLLVTVERTRNPAVYFSL